MKFFRNHNDALAALISANISRPPLPCDVRWNSLRNSLVYYKENWSRLFDIITRLKSASKEETEILENLQIRRSIDQMLEIFDFLFQQLSLVQSDHANLSDAWHSFCEISMSIY